LPHQEAVTRVGLGGRIVREGVVEVGEPNFVASVEDVIENATVAALEVDGL
jgi:hypothetical protein